MAIQDSRFFHSRTFLALLTFFSLPFNMTSAVPYLMAVELPQTGQTVSDIVGDDGDLQIGVAWPTPRFVDNGDGTLTDNLTGLM